MFFLKFLSVKSFPAFEKLFQLMKELHMNLFELHMNFKSGNPLYQNLMKVPIIENESYDFGL